MRSLKCLGAVLCTAVMVSASVPAAADRGTAPSAFTITHGSNCRAFYPPDWSGDAGTGIAATQWGALNYAGANRWVSCPVTNQRVSGDEHEIWVYYYDSTHTMSCTLTSLNYGSYTSVTQSVGSYDYGALRFVVSYNGTRPYMVFCNMPPYARIERIEHQAWWIE